MTDIQMIRLAQNYLREVGELKQSYPSYEHLLQSCIDVFNKRKEWGLEIAYEDQ